jgi:hypothetical protein
MRTWGGVKRQLVVVCALVMLLGALAPVGTAGAAIINGNGWQFGLGQCDAGPGIATASFGPGPVYPPMGVGSLTMDIDASGHGFPQMRNEEFSGTKLKELTTLRYSTFIAKIGAATVAPFIMLEVDLNKDGKVDDELIYQPAVNGSIQTFDWQTWDAFAGKWWSRQGLASMGSPAAAKPLSAYIAAYPDATIVNGDGIGGLRLAAGCIGDGWGGLTVSVDAVVVGKNGVNVVYDFEPDGVIRSAPGDIYAANFPVLDQLTPAPFSTVAPGMVTVSAHAQSNSAISTLALSVDGQAQTPTIQTGASGDVTATVTLSLTAGTYTVLATATDAEADSFSAEWDFVVASNAAETEWFNADGTPKGDQINATLRSLVEAFRWHLYSQSWDGQDHPELPRHAGTITQAAALNTWVNNGAFDQAYTQATLKSLVEAFRWHFWGISWDNQAHCDIPTHYSNCNAFLPPQSISPWFNADGTPIPANINATMRSLVEAFRWHFWGYSWDGGQHFDSMPTHRS